MFLRHERDRITRSAGSPKSIKKVVRVVVVGEGVEAQVEKGPFCMGGGVTKLVDWIAVGSLHTHRPSAASHFPRDPIEGEKLIDMLEIDSSILDPSFLCFDSYRIRFVAYGSFFPLRYPHK